MSYNVQSEDLDILRQASREIYAKVELLNREFKTVGELEGQMISDSYSVDASSDVRRTYSIELHILSGTFSAGAYSIWVDKYIRLSTGLRHVRTGKIRWYDQGTYIFNSSSYQYDSTTKTLSLSCSDLMCKHTGDRGGQMSGAGTVIEAGSDARQALISFLTDVCGVTQYSIRDLPETIPYDFTFSMGSNEIDVLREFRGIDVGLEFFYDGTMFVFRRYPTMTSDPIVLDADQIDPLIISLSRSVDYSSIKNVTELWGATSEGESETVDAAAIVKLVSVEPTQEQMDYDIEHEPYDNIAYVVDPDSPYTVEKIGEVRQVLSDGEYSNIHTDELAMERAKYENWLSTDLLDSIDITMMDIPWLDVNQKIEVNVDGVKDTYLVQHKSGSSSDGTMTINCTRFQPIYSWL